MLCILLPLLTTSCTLNQCELVSGHSNLLRLSATVQSGDIKVDGRIRHYLAYIPANLPKNSPLLLVLHGSLSSPTQMRDLTARQFEKLADQYHFAVVYPEGFEYHWNDCRKKARYSARIQHINDVDFIRSLVKQFQQQYQINLARVYAMGYSNGGQMAFRLALEAPDLISAIAVVSANLPTTDNLDCVPAGKPVSVLILNGTVDPINPYYGGKVTIFGFNNRGRVRSTLESATWFAERSKAELTKKEERLPQLYPSKLFWAERSVWKSSTGIEVAMIAIHGGGHTLPQPYITYPVIFGWTYAGMDGPLEIWRFFLRQQSLTGV